jgi:hypothetical protein
VRHRLVVSFSGGKTSGYMAKKLFDGYRDKYAMLVIFANTGLECEETLEFVDRCDRIWGFGLRWVEAVVHHGQEKASTHKEVSFETASRNGQPFEEVIKKYGIPNMAYPHCTRELKANPIRSYVHTIWSPGTYRIAVGIRGDERQRVTQQPEFVYPLTETPHLFKGLEFPDMYATKPMINDWWEEQPFTLNLQEHEGNCQTCFKKSTPKLVRIAQEHPTRFDFTHRMEQKYGLAGHNEDGTKRVFYRGNMSTETILYLARTSTAPPHFNHADEFGGCSESCEAFS